MHHIFQRQGIPPDEFYKKPYKVQMFMLVSTQVQLEQEQEMLNQWLSNLNKGRGGNGG